METIPLTKDKYGQWDEFCLNNSDAWFWHTTDWLEYTLEYIPNSVSLSFMVTENKKVLAICPLILKSNEFSMFWFPALSDSLGALGKKRERVFDFIFKNIDKLAKENDVLRASFMIYPLSFPNYNYLMKQDYIDISLNTQVIDLRQDLKIIHGAMRKGHDYDIDRGLKEIEVKIFNNDSILREDFDSYQLLHHKDAGRITRSQATFDLMYKWILDGNAMLFGATKNNHWIGFSLINTYKGRAYYGSACSDPEYRLPIGHIILWKAIEWLKAFGFEYFELGWQQYSSQPYDIITKKDAEISFFKRGFGGFALPFYRGEKYYSRDYYLEVNSKRVNRYALELKT